MNVKHIMVRDEGVSPVIGVMLMLVVTIIIAALVTGFSSSLVDTETASPVSYLDVEILANQGAALDQYVMNIKHLGGDTLDTADLEITSEYAYDQYDATAKTVTAHRTSATITSVSRSVILQKKTAETDAIRAKVPYLSDMSVETPSDPAVQYGSFDFTAGDIMTTGNSVGTQMMLTGSSTGKLPAGFGVGSKVDISIMHVPSNTVIFSKEVRVA